jgi:hypothetical protein
MRLELPLAAKDGPLVEAARKAGIAFASFGRNRPGRCTKPDFAV